MNRYVLGFCLALCVATACIVGHFCTSTRPAGPSEDAARQERQRQLESQRAEAANEVGRIVAGANPEAEAAVDRDPELQRARRQRLDAMAEAIRQAVDTPTPAPRMPAPENSPP